jgi:hypothetical protein
MGPHRDSSVALHTSPTGPVKYARHKTSSIWNEKKGMLSSIRMGLTSSLDASIGSGEVAECFTYNNSLMGDSSNSFNFTLTSRIGKGYNATAGQIALTWVLTQGKDFRYVGVRRVSRLN